MGNCITRSPQGAFNPRASAISPKESATAKKAEEAKKTEVAVKIQAPPNSAFSLYFRYALHLKSVPYRLIPSQDGTFLIINNDPLSGSRESLLRILDERFPSPRHPRLVPAAGSIYRKEGSLLLLLLEGQTTPLVVRMAALHHRSITWHLERLVRRVEDLKSLGSGSKKKNIDMRMELKNFSEKYNCLLDVLMEHAQMEERIVFPVLDAADQGLCEAANAEHGRHFPIMNGIKEVIKVVQVLPIGGPDYTEALSDLLKRVKSLEKHCKTHFEEEERDVLGLMETVDLSEEQQQRMVERCVDLMQATHAAHFAFLVEGLLPYECMLYFDLLIRCKDESQAVWMLRRLVH